jgi:hypothetical protein
MFKSLLSSFLLIATLIAISPLVLSAQSNSALRLAVLDQTPVESVDISQRELVYLENSLRRIAANKLTEYVSVMTSENTISLLRDSGIDPRDCRDGSCAIETARTLQADWLLSMELFQFGADYKLQLNLYETEEGRLLASEEVSSASFLELSDKATKATDPLFTYITRESTSSKKQNIAVLKLKLKPNSSVFVVVDDAVIGSKVVPNSGQLTFSLKPGAHEIRLSCDGFKDWAQAIQLDADKTTTLSVTFEQGQGSEIRQTGNIGVLVVRSSPTGAVIFVDGLEVGTSNFTMDEISAGAHTIELRKPLYKPWLENINIAADNVYQLNADLESDFAPLYITSFPAGAMVSIDGQQRGTTPMRLDRFASGNYSLRLTLPMYHDLKKSITVVPDEKQSLQLKMLPAFGSVRISPSASSAVIYLDDQLLGTGNQFKNEVVSGEHRILVKSDLYNNYEKMITVHDGEQFEIDVELSQNFGKVRVLSDPKNASVFIDGKKEGATPLTLKLEPGSYKLVVKAENYVKIEKTLNLAVRDDVVEKLDLVRMTGSVLIKSEPMDANVLLGGKSRGLTPVQVNDLPTGTYELVLSKNGYADYHQTLKIEHNNRSIVEKPLSKTAYMAWKKRHKNAIVSSALIPGLGQIKHKQTRGFAYLLVFGGAVAMAVKSNSDYERAENDYQESYEFYKSSQTQHDVDEHWSGVQIAYDDMKTSHDMHQLFFGIAVGIYAVNLIDAIFWGGGKATTGQNDFSQNTAAPGWNLTPYVGSSPYSHSKQNVGLALTLIIW